MKIFKVQIFAKHCRYSSNLKLKSGFLTTFDLDSNKNKENDKRPKSISIFRPYELKSIDIDEKVILRVLSKSQLNNTANFPLTVEIPREEEDQTLTQNGVLNDNRFDYLKSNSAQFLLHWKEAAYGLSKFRLTSFVVMSALAGCALACTTPFSSVLFNNHALSSVACLTLGTGLMSASANSVNQILEIPYDSQMKRTQARVLVRGHIDPGEALIFAISSGLGGFGMLFAGLNPTVAMLGLANWLLYTSVYTPLKRVHEVNTWVGAFVGAIPPLMGWAAVTGGLEAGSLILATLLYTWQFPHFMALSWNLRSEYSRAGYAMTSVLDPMRCQRVALRHSIVPIFVCLAGAGCNAVSLGAWCGWALGMCSLPINAAFVLYAYRFYRAPRHESSQAARQLFFISLLHLPTVILAILVSSHWDNISHFICS